MHTKWLTMLKFIRSQKHCQKIPEGSCCSWVYVTFHRCYCAATAIHSVSFTGTDTCETGSWCRKKLEIEKCKILIFKTCTHHPWLQVKIHFKLIMLTFNWRRHLMTDCILHILHWKHTIYNIILLLYRNIFFYRCSALIYM